MLTTSKKEKILDILWEGTTHDELLMIFWTIKALVVKYGKKIYSEDFIAIVSKQHKMLGAVLEVLGTKDPDNNIQTYIKLIQQKANNHSLLVPKDYDISTNAHITSNENLWILYRDGDTVYKRYLDRDLQKLLSK